MSNNKCLDYALKYLHRFPKTEKELQIQLLKKGYSENEISNAMQYLKSKQYINDEKFAQLYINGEIFQKGKPILLIKQKLLAKGIGKEIFEKILENNQEFLKSGISEKIKTLIDKYKKQNKDKFEIMRKLMQRGYSLNDIKSVINGNE